MNEEIELGDCLGIGAFSIVYEVKHRANTVAKLPIPGKPPYALLFSEILVQDVQQIIPKKSPFFSKLQESF
jgi:hypothetical protein